MRGYTESLAHVALLRRRDRIGTTLVSQWRGLAATHSVVAPVDQAPPGALSSPICRTSPPNSSWR